MNRTDFIIEVAMEKIGEYLQETQEPQMMMVYYLANLLGSKLDEIDSLRKRLAIYEKKTTCN